MNRVSDNRILFVSWHEDGSSSYDYGMCIDDDRADLRNIICISFEPVNHRPHKWLMFEQWAMQYAYVLNWNRLVWSRNSVYHPYIFWQIGWESDIFDSGLIPTYLPPDQYDRILTFAGADKNAYHVVRDLYIERKRFIDEAAKRFSPEEFSIFGNDWKGKYPHARGAVPLKSDTMRGAKFAFVIENETDDTLCHGYATEKIYDAIRCGAVPIYLGAPNIDELIPPDPVYGRCWIPYNCNPKSTLEMLGDESLHTAALESGRNFIKSTRYRDLIHPSALYRTLADVLL